MQEVKAISQNVLHANAIITDQVYSALTNGQVQTAITAFANKKRRIQNNCSASSMRSGRRSPKTIYFFSRFSR